MVKALLELCPDADISKAIAVFRVQDCVAGIGFFAGDRTSVP
jgi:hypothetical protein